MRKPEPFYRKQTASWYVQIDGKFVPLGGKGKPGKTPPPEVLEKYYALMAGRQPDDGADDCTVHQLADRFLSDLKKTRAHRTIAKCATTFTRRRRGHVREVLMSGRNDTRPDALNGAPGDQQVVRGRPHCRRAGPYPEFVAANS